MAGFQKPKPLQKSLKLAMFGRAGTGKSFTALLFGEGLARRDGKRIAYVDTEHGTDFYAMAVPARPVHPEAFDFDALYARSVKEVEAAVKSLNPEEYGVIVIDSITHLWENAIASYQGKKTKIGTLPIHAWGKIKQPYKALEQWLMNSPFHVIWCGREGTQFGKDEDGTDVSLGPKMKAEGETAHEPNVLLHLGTELKGGRTIIYADATKDRTGILSGRRIEFPNFENVVAPILEHLTGESQAQLPDDEDARIATAETVADEDLDRQEDSARLFRQLKAEYDLANDEAAWSEVNNRVTPDVKRRLTNEDLAAVRELARETARALGIVQKPRKK